MKMSKKYKHIIFTLSLAIIFSFGSMAGMMMLGSMLGF